MVILTFSYHDAYNELRFWDSQPMSVDNAMSRVMRLVQSGADVIQHHDTGRMDVLLIHRVTGITIVPVVG